MPPNIFSLTFGKITFWTLTSCYLIFAFAQLIPDDHSFASLLNTLLSDPLSLLTLKWPWIDMELSQRGDFVAGFFAPLALCVASFAIILQHRSLKLQQEELKGQRQELQGQREELKMQRKSAEEQTRIFNEELTNQRRSDWRNEIQSLEYQLQRHARIIHENAIKDYTKPRGADYNVADVEQCNSALLANDLEFIENIPSETKSRLIDSICFYVQRMESLRDRAISSGVLSEFLDYQYYTPYGNLYLTCSTKVLNAFKDKVALRKSRSWYYDNQANQWLLKAKEQKEFTRITKGLFREEILST